MRGDRRRVLLGAFMAIGLTFGLSGAATADPLDDQVQAAAVKVEAKVIAWRRDIHQHPELSNREVRTAQLVADHLRALGFDEVRTGVGHTGVIAVLRGGKPGPTVALRADMDALPVTEEVDLPFASKVRATYNGQEVGVMHACGHDAHTAMLMGVAEVLAGMRSDIPGAIQFIFQPAEEGAPAGEEGGAKLLVKEGVLVGSPKPQAIFGLHVWPAPAGTIGYRARGAMAAADEFTISVQGRQTHGSSPWLGVDPVPVAAQIVTGLQMIPSRQLDITKAPSVITVGQISGGVRFNIIPDRVELAGTIRTFDPEVRAELLKKLERTAARIAESAGATAKVTIIPYAPVVFNDPALTAQVLPSLEKAAGKANVHEQGMIMGSEDFSFYQEQIPGVFFLLGINKPGVEVGAAAANHSPLFYVNEDALKVGVKALSFAALDYLRGQASVP